MPRPAPAPRPAIAKIRDALARHGLALRGGFHPGPDDGVPPLAEGEGALPGTLLLAGHAGPAMWRAFERARPAGPHPLDDWSGRVLGAIARRFAGRALLPSDGPPYLPFQRWAMKAEPVFASPLGVLIHPDYGLWHGYRGALALAARLELPAADERPSPCDSCAEKPCLSSCPVGAFSTAGYDVPACVAHLNAPAGADCLAEGCRARRACPVGRDYVYAPAQANFHMAAFVRALHGGD